MTEQIDHMNNVAADNVLALKKTIRVMIAEDSATIRHYLVGLINETPGLEVVGQAANGEEALALVETLKPDVISMDINMPRLDGFDATRRIMAEHPTPVVVVSGLVEKDIDLSFQALEAGALAVVEKPPDRRNPSFHKKQLHLVRTLVAMAGVSVVRRGTSVLAPAREDSRRVVEAPMVDTGPEIIAIGASAGGPSALSKLLSELPGDFPVPIVIAQHIPQEFVVGLARWLDKNSPLRVQVAKDGIALEQGVVNLSPGTTHLKVLRRGESLGVRLVSEKGDYRYQPSVDVLFESVAQVCGERAVGLILTGMGDDGATGLLQMRQVGARTVVQDKESCTVFGMPAAAIEREAAEQVKSLTDLPSAILGLL